jgi:hypothetical protein
MRRVLGDFDINDSHGAPAELSDIEALAWLDGYCTAGDDIRKAMGNGR